MRAFTQHDGLVAPMDRANVDTDLMIPKQFLKSIKRSGFGPNLFDDLRYLDEGAPGADNSVRPLNPEFPLNFPRYQNASILLARENFGCGSSREHAAWALADDGFCCVIAPSFADIFRSNALKNGILPIELSATQVQVLFDMLFETEGFRLQVDLSANTLTLPNGDIWPFQIDAFRRECLLQGLDDVGITLESTDAIKAFEEHHAKRFPWLFEDLVL
ncbi:3-isopropylmalate dehydratase small subunit [Luminiphilus sp.]|jgi:3-isopropylmalate/(R)-2-methylmalate dehydratase small subunit|nr:3-isopropylmalate dehydratase small subunit [Luminiphilus sp.]MBT6353061.1 3-isopropylmalate dehydratase small subunit [Halieaceae bacterium]MBL6897704.1 3-isopropylmalate dehydratase small subunit [Luminiphilus sp.]MCH1580973.1 3-isopropylmalate dehydratase small subunit [Luminiphilus sp.]MDB2688950.1 3-isopropylmalate dehydratase small subunit [Luminiphilus sp.]